MGPIIRIALRYIAGALVAYGIVPADLASEVASDPDVISLLMDGANWTVILLGTGLAGLIEWVYAFAKKHGWAT